MAVHQLFELHHLKIYRFFVRLSGDQSTAEDLTQEVFLRALRAQSRFSASGRDEAWLFRIARNLWIDRERRRRRRPRLEHDPPDPAPVSARQELRLRLEEAVRALPEVEREAFLLREVGGLSYEQIASVCRIGLEAVRSRIYRARRSLREALDERPDELHLMEKVP